MQNAQNTSVAAEPEADTIEEEDTEELTGDGEDTLAIVDETAGKYSFQSYILRMTS